MAINPSEEQLPSQIFKSKKLLMKRKKMMMIMVTETATTKITIIRCYPQISKEC